MPEYLGVIAGCRLRPARAQSRKAGYRLAHGWRGGGMKVLITLFVLAVLGLMWLRHENGNLSRSFETANRVASEQKATIGMLKNQLSVAGQLARRNESAQVALREQLAKAGAEANRREQTITRLLDENEAFRRCITLLCLMLCAGCTPAPPAPAPVIVVSGMPEGEPLPMPGSDPKTNGDLSADIRRLEGALTACALQVKTVKHCQDELDAEAQKPAQGAD
ncbi:lysozyme [Salmonella bongori]|nr:lysozyme [Salmonella bongori]